MTERKNATISVVINTLNAERILEECLNSVKDADEIVICDMHSEDKTIEIAEKHGCKICYHERCRCAEPARNYADSQATSDWILVLDADELVTPELWAYLKDFATNSPEEIVALEIPRTTFALGKKLRSMYQRKLRRFWRNGSCEWKGHVHNIPETLYGKSVIVPATKKNVAIQHYHIDSLQSYLEKMNRYTDLEMDRFKTKGTKFKLARLLFRPLYEFFKFYILKGGFLDGTIGFIICCMNTQYKFMQLAKLYEVEYKAKNPDLLY